MSDVSTMTADRKCIFLKSHNFLSMAEASWQDLQIETNFCDVTLASDGQQLLAHRLVHASSSPFHFRNILKQNVGQHPLIYLRGVKYENLQNLLIFMYHGEVDVASDDLDSFIEMAEYLKVKGLSEEKIESSSKEISAEKEKIMKKVPDIKPNTMIAKICLLVSRIVITKYKNGRL